MAFYSKSGNAVSLNKVHAYAKAKVESELISNLYNRVPLLAFLAGKGKNDAPLGRPGAAALLSGKTLKGAERAKELGVEVHDKHIFEAVGGFKYMGAKGTSPSTGSVAFNDKPRTAVFRNTRAQQAIKIDNFVHAVAKGSEAIGSVTDDAVNQAMDEMLDQLNLDFWRGNPTDQTADIWDNFLGVLQAMDTDNTYGNLDRSTYTGYAAKRVTTATSPSLALVDDANLVQGVINKSGPLDLVITSNAIYNDLKQEALARGVTVSVGTMPQMAEVGVEQEGIKYGPTWITFDPNLTGDWSSYDSDVSDATKVWAGFHTDQWRFTADPAENFMVTPFIDQSDVPGGDDAITARIKLMARLRCKKPQNEIVYTNVG